MKKISNYKEFINESKNNNLEFRELSSAAKKHAIEKYRNDSADAFYDIDFDDDMSPDHPYNLFKNNLYGMGLDDIDAVYKENGFKVTDPTFSARVSNKSKFFKEPGLNMVKLPNSMSKDEKDLFFKKLEQTDITIKKGSVKVAIPENIKIWLKNNKADVEGLKKEMERNITLWAKKQSENYGDLMQKAYDYVSSDKGVSTYLIDFKFNEKGNKVS